MLSNILDNFRLLKYFNSKFKCSNKKSNIILIEYFDYKPSLIVFVLLYACLKKRYDARIILYLPNFLGTFKKIYFRLINTFKPFSLLWYYWALGSSELIIPNKKNSSKKKNIKFKNKNNVLNFKYKNILIGDLMYDQYLRYHNKITIDVYDLNFKKHVNETLELFNFWFTYLESNKVKSLIISHSVYNMGIIARIAIYLKIPVYNPGPNGLFYLSKKYSTKHSPEEYKRYPQIFRKFSLNIKKKLILNSKRNLKERFKGKRDIKILLDRPTKSDFYKKNFSRKLTFNKNKVKILVQAHQLNDAVHVYGKNLFVDFFEWFEYLGKLSKNRDFTWIIKPHPAEFSHNMGYYDELKIKYPQFNILNSNITNSDLINENINGVTTVYGSGGSEFPLFGIPVINASYNNPHIGYNFNYHPKSIAAYGNLLNNIKNLKVSKKEASKIYEFYALRYTLDFTPIKNQEFYVKKFEQNFKDNYVNIFLNQLNHDRENEIENDIENFIKSKNYKLYYLKNIN